MELIQVQIERFFYITQGHLLVLSPLYHNIFLQFCEQQEGGTGMSRQSGRGEEADGRAADDGIT